MATPLTQYAADILNQVADGLIIDNIPDMGPWELLKLELKFERTTLRFRIQGHPYLVRLRASRLLRVRPQNGTPGIKAMRTASKWRPTLKAAKRSAKVAQQFLDDGERDNYEAYNALFDVAGAN